MNARITENLIAVTETQLGLTVDVTNGWDDVQKLVNRVLELDGKYFVFSGWNSDRNVAFFKIPVPCARIARVL